MILYCCLETFPRKIMKLAVEVALISGTPWELSSLASLPCFSTQMLKQELKFHLLYFGCSVYSRIWKMLLEVIPWHFFLEKRVLTVMSNPIPDERIIFCSPNFSLRCQSATLSCCAPCFHVLMNSYCISSSHWWMSCFSQWDLVGFPKLLGILLGNRHYIHRSF